MVGLNFQRGLKAESSYDRKAGNIRDGPEKRPPKGAVAGKKSVIQQTKNEPVVGRNKYHRARPCKGAKLTPWIWAGRTKEVRTHTDRWDDPGRHGR